MTAGMAWLTAEPWMTEGWTEGPSESSESSERRRTFARLLCRHAERGVQIPLDPILLLVLVSLCVLSRVVGHQEYCVSPTSGYSCSVGRCCVT